MEEPPVNDQDQDNEPIVEESEGEESNIDDMPTDE